MILNILKLALRNILHNKTVSTLNIVGLSLGLGTSFVILLYILSEVGYDDYHKKKDQLYRVITEDLKFNSKTPNAPFILAPTLQEEISGIERTSRIYNLVAQIMFDKQWERISHFRSVDPSLLKMFSIQLIKGDLETALDEPTSVLVSERMASKYCPDSDAINKVLVFYINGKPRRLKITGIFKDIPSKSTFKANFIGPILFAEESINKTWSTYHDNPTENWTLPTLSTYILINKNSDIGDIRLALTGFNKRHSDEQRPLAYSFQPISKIYLHSKHLDNNSLPQGNLRNLYIFSAIAIIGLLMSATNFVLLSIARTSTRAKEIGMRKILGADRLTIFYQIMIESVILSIITLPFAFIVAFLILPIFNTYLGFELSIYSNWNISYSIWIVVITILLGAIPGIYISIHLSRLEPIRIINSRMSNVNTKSIFWKILIGLQLVIFISLITISLTVYRQMRYTKKIDMGFNKENLILIGDASSGEFFRKVDISLENIELYATRIKSFKNVIQNNSNIVNASTVSHIPPTGHSMRSPWYKYQQPDEEVIIEGIAVDQDFIETLEIKIVEGVQFKDSSGAFREGSYLLNETAAKILEIEKLTTYDDKLIGIVKDFQIHSIYEKVPPLSVELQTQFNTCLIIKVSSINIDKTINFLAGEWKKVFPDIPFNYSFWDNHVDRLYQSDLKFEKIVRSFTSITILIACIGLLGLSLFISERRLNEIGIRKVLGATALDIIQLLYREFIVIILVSTIISVPIVTYLIGGWLQEFEYQVSLNSFSFVISSLFAIFIIFLTLGFKIINASLTNPVNILRYE